MKTNIKNSNNLLSIEVEDEVFLTSRYVKIGMVMDSLNQLALSKKRKNKIFQYLINGEIDNITITPYLDNVFRWETKRLDNTGKEPHDIVIMCNFWYSGTNWEIHQVFRDLADELECEVL